MGSLWLVACTEGCLSQTDRGTEVQRQGTTCPEPGENSGSRPLTRLFHHLGASSFGRVAELNL